MNSTDCPEESKKTSFPDPILCKRYPGVNFVGTPMKHWNHEIYLPMTNGSIFVYSPNGNRKRTLRQEIVGPQEPVYTIMRGCLYAAQERGRIEGFDIKTGKLVRIFPPSFESDVIYDMVADSKRKQIAIALAGECVFLSSEGKEIAQISVSQNKKSRHHSPSLYILGKTLLYDDPDHECVYFIDLRTLKWVGRSANSALGGSYLFHKGLAFHHSMYTNDLMVLNPFKNSWELAWSPGDLSGLTYVVCCRNFFFAESDKAGPDEKYGLEIWNLREVFEECIRRNFNLGAQDMVSKLLNQKDLSASLFQDVRNIGNVYSSL